MSLSRFYLPLRRTRAPTRRPTVVLLSSLHHLERLGLVFLLRLLLLQLPRLLRLLILAIPLNHVLFSHTLNLLGIPKVLLMHDASSVPVCVLQASYRLPIAKPILVRNLSLLLPPMRVSLRLQVSRLLLEYLLQTNLRLSPQSCLSVHHK